MGKIVMIFGTFDGIHKGHRDFIRQARALGERVIAVVARDETVIHIKGRKPHHDENERLEAARAISGIDIAILGSTGDKHAVIVKHKPDIIALGYDQRSFETGLEETLRKHGLQNTAIVRLKPYKPEIYKSSFMKNAKSEARNPREI